MIQTPEICEFLDWDTTFFGHRIARVVGHRLTRQGIQQVLSWCKAHQIDCLYFLADVEDPETILWAEEWGFHLVDIRVTLQCRIHERTGQSNNTASSTVQVRPFQETDWSHLRILVRSNHRDSRFYFDPHFPNELCDSLYETWLQRSCAGYADAVLVADFAGCPSGYISCHLPREEPWGRIGLMGVAPSARGHGLGRSLVTQALAWFAGRGVDLVQVVTQGRNIPAQRLYQRCGFLTNQVQLWYHKWMSTG